MYCTNCGAMTQEGAIACTQCGLPPRKKNNFCHNCGQSLNSEQIVCLQCGVAVGSGRGLSGAVQGVVAGEKNRTTAGVLGILLGGIGVHKFYLGSWGWGLVYLVMCWTYVPAILGLVEGIMYLTKSDAEFSVRYPVSTQSPFRW